MSRCVHVSVRVPASRRTLNECSRLCRRCVSPCPTHVCLLLQAGPVFSPLWAASSWGVGPPELRSLRPLLSRLVTARARPGERERARVPSDETFQWCLRSRIPWSGWRFLFLPSPSAYPTLSALRPAAYTDHAHGSQRRPTSLTCRRRAQVSPTVRGNAGRSLTSLRPEGRSGGGQGRAVQASGCAWSRMPTAGGGCKHLGPLCKWWLPTRHTCPGSSVSLLQGGRMQGTERASDFPGATEPVHGCLRT